MRRLLLCFISSFILILFSSYAVTTAPEETSDFIQNHVIHLSKGWNVIGYNLNVEAPVEKIKNTCKLEPYEGYEVFKYTGNEEKPWDYPTKLQAGNGYYIKSKEDCTIVLPGAPAKLEKLVLKSGWNLMSPPKLVTFSSILGDCKGKLDDEEYVLGLNEDTGKIDLQSSVIEPGNAYWIFAKANCELDFSDRKQVPPKKGEIKEMTFYSNALKKDRNYNIYLPSSYSTSSKRYPVLYLMHGAADDHNTWLRSDRGKIGEILEKLINDNQLEEIIFVMPDIDSSGLENGCSGFVIQTNLQILKARSCGNYEDYIVKDLIPHIDSTYRTIQDKSARGILGFSTGGHGALWVAFRNPESFSFVAGYSGFYVTWNFIPIDPIPFTSVDEIRIFNEVKIPPKDKISHMKIHLEVSKYDPFAKKPTEKFHNRLKKAGIEHTYLVTSGGFNPLYTHGWGFISDNIHKGILTYNDNLVQFVALIKAQ